jgi:hypothetical protein
VAEVREVRRRRHSRDELRALLIAAGREILEEEGLTVGAGDLTFKRVFDEVEADTGVRLTNASVIRRVWENQDDFQADVLVELVSTGNSSGELDRTLEALTPMLRSADRSTPEARMRSLRELSRVCGDVAIRARLGTREWSLWIGVWVLALTTTLSGRRQHLRAALVDGLESVTDLWEELFHGVCAHLGIRSRAPLTVRQFTIAVSAMVEGSALRQGGDPELELITRPTGPGGSLQEWTLFGVCLEALALRFFEIDPDWVAVGEPPALAAPTPSTGGGRG